MNKSRLVVFSVKRFVARKPTFLFDLFLGYVIINNMNIHYKTLTENLLDKFEEYHSLLEVPINGIIWENLLFNCLSMQSDSVEWSYKSHKTGEDINFEGVGISCKGGRLQGKNKDKLKISSYRSTRQKTLQEKIDYFEDKHEDVYFCLCYEETETEHKYKLYTFDSDILDYRNLKWEGWEGNGKFRAKIEKSMSDQLWLWLPTNLLNEQFEIEIKKSIIYNNVAV